MEDGGYMADQTQTNELLALTTDIVSSHVSNNTVQGGELPQLIQSVFGALANAGSGGAMGSSPRPQPAVPIKRSVRPDFITCLEDGKKLKMLKRHITTRYNMTPEE